MRSPKETLGLMRASLLLAATFACQVKPAPQNEKQAATDAPQAAPIVSSASAPIASHKARAADVAPATEETASCADDKRVMPRRTPVEAKGALGALSFVMVSSKPPELTRGMNQLTIEVRDGADVARNVQALVIVPTMPDHGHGAQTVPRVRGRAGRFVIDGVDLFMPGVWRIGLRANDRQGQALDTGALYFCIEG